MIAPLLSLVCALVSSAPAPQQPAAAPERSPFEAASWGVVYDVPATAKVKVERNVTFQRSGGRDLQLDLYLPPDAKTPPPVVVFANGVGDRLPDRVKEWGIYSTWPRLVAAHGMASVSMDCDGEDVQGSLRAVLAFLEREGAKRGFDGKRVGVYAASANVSETSRLLLAEGAPANVLSVAFYYGVPEVALARRDLSVLCITAEGDLGHARTGIDAAWTKAMDARAPWTFELASGLPHAFDALSDRDEARRVIQRTLAFWRSTLEPMPQPTWERSEARAVVEAMYWNDPPLALERLGAWIAAHPDDAHGYAARGMIVARTRDMRAARADLEKALALGSDEAGVHGNYGVALAVAGEHAKAVEHLQRAVANGYFGPELLGYLGHSQLVLGQNEAAVASYERALEMGVPPGASTLGVAHYNLACGYARLGRIEDALASIERAVEQRFGTRRAYETDEDLKPLRVEERFLVAMDKLGGG